MQQAKDFIIREFTRIVLTSMDFILFVTWGFIVIINLVMAMVITTIIDFILINHQA